ncbi:DUF4865 family protein [Streptomyces sp. NPDC059593]|uniref:DUF4865 family protein n=1 Tax=Streptomyces sp. NPDC059593 TaxID=3346878 RepID=UPI003674E253
MSGAGSLQFRCGVASALAVDPRHWELLAFTLWADVDGVGAEAPADEGEPFRVLHLSAPGRDGLGAGRRRW